VELGGADLDQLVYEIVLEKAREELGEHLEPFVEKQLLRHCEQIKIALSSTDVWDEPLAIKGGKGAILLDLEVTRREFETRARPLVDRVLAAAERCLKKAPEGAMDPQQVSDVILVGGSCRIPLLQHGIERMFEKRGRIDINPMEVVALGAAYQADHAEHTGATVVVHSLATSLGVSCLGPDSSGILRDDMFFPILPATSKLPVRRTHSFATIHDNQSSILVRVFETEQERTEGLEPWDTRQITGLPAVKAGSYDIDVTFDYNVEQVLEVTVDIPEYGIHESWKPRFLQRIEEQRATSQAKIEEVATSMLDGLESFASRVAAALKGAAHAPRSSDLLQNLRRALERRDLEEAREVKDRLAETLFDEGVTI